MKIVFMGTPRAAILTLERILKDGHEVVEVWTQPDKPAGRGNKLTAPPVKEFALEKKLQVFQPKKIKTPEALEKFKSHNADAEVVVAYGRILPESFLKAFPKGAINVHFSLLPKFRGAAPVNWAIVHGEEKTGVTTMQMDVGLDTGDILLQRETEIGEEENAIELMERLAIHGAELLSETLRKIDGIQPQKQNELEATYAPILKKEDGLISWSLNAPDISNRVRGFQPFPAAFSFYNEKKITIWKAKPAESIDKHSPFSIHGFGKILRAKGDKFLVACGGDSVLRIEELQLEGKRRISARDFLNGTKIQIGEKLG